LCPIDCHPDAKKLWACSNQKCKAQVNACNQSAACVSALNAGLTCMMACGSMSATCGQKCVPQFSKNPDAMKLATCAMSNGCLSQTPTGPKCGDGKCEAPENSSTCPADCKAPPVKKCGNTVCESGESANTCPIDCEAEAKKTWQCLQQKCKKEADKCMQDSGCLKALNDATLCQKKCTDGGGKPDSCASQCQGHVLGNSKTLNLVVCGLNACQAP